MPVLLIFTKNLIKGTVKTRIAKDVGDEMALQIYKLLLAHTRDLVADLAVKKYVFYNRFIPKKDEWNPNVFEKRLQVTGDLGTKMSAAFQKTFEQGYEKVVIIGSDCADLQQQHVQIAFEALTTHDFVIGPAQDGGYYLLGMKAFYPSLFQNKQWSTANVLATTIQNIVELKKSYYLLPELSDVDFYQDVPEKILKQI